ncbi:unnamed protein product [Amoebophrya sp. A25]|nr:unnamed protein product [Amoebophrya sp. A25]|eukprot:GSA25T00024100001.1
MNKMKLLLGAAVLPYGFVFAFFDGLRFPSIASGKGSSASGDFVCPGSAAWIHHASCQVEMVTDMPCSSVREEVLARVAGENHWLDPHNHGTYAIAKNKDQGTEGEDDSSVVSLQRTTRSTPAYTDLITLQFVDDEGKNSDEAPSGASCRVRGCSESQVTSWLDFSTNYCNIHNLLCGSADGCAYAKHDLHTRDETLGTCSASNARSCASTASSGTSAITALASTPSVIEEEPTEQGVLEGRKLAATEKMNYNKNVDIHVVHPEEDLTPKLQEDASTSFETDTRIYE